jgi:hypothetical protein
VLHRADIVLPVHVQRIHLGVQDDLHQQPRLRGRRALQRRSLRRLRPHRRCLFLRRRLRVRCLCRRPLLRRTLRRIVRSVRSRRLRRTLHLRSSGNRSRQRVPRSGALRRKLRRRRCVHDGASRRHVRTGVVRHRCDRVSDLRRLRNVLDRFAELRALRLRSEPSDLLQHVYDQRGVLRVRGVRQRNVPRPVAGRTRLHGGKSVRFRLLRRRRLL